MYARMLGDKIVDKLHSASGCVTSTWRARGGGRFEVHTTVVGNQTQKAVSGNIHSS